MSISIYNEKEGNEEKQFTRLGSIMIIIYALVIFYIIPKDIIQLYI